MRDPHLKTDQDVLDVKNREWTQQGRLSSTGDLELIRWALSLSLEERLAVLQDFVDTFWTPQHG